MGERLEWVTDDRGFDALSHAWEPLVRKERSPFSDHAWFSCWWKAFGGGWNLRIHTVWRGDELVAAAPLRARGRRLASMANYHTPMFRIPAQDHDALRAVSEQILAERPSEVCLHAIPADDPSLSAFAEASARRRRVTFVEPVHLSPIVDTSGTLGEWEESHRARLTTLWRRRRKLQREYDSEFLFVDDPSNLDADLDRGFAVEASGWKRNAGTAVDAQDATALFYRSVARAYGARGELRLAWLFIDGSPAAFNLCLERGRRLYLLKTGFDESLRKLAPGLILNLCVIERCFESHLEAYELLGAEEEWKRRFATGRREHARLWSYRMRPFSLLRYASRRHGYGIARTVYDRVLRSRR